MGAPPQVAEMIVPKISDAIGWTDTVVVNSADVYAAAQTKLYSILPNSTGNAAQGNRSSPFPDLGPCEVREFPAPNDTELGFS